MPWPPLPVMRLRCAGDVPPMMFDEEFETVMPFPVLACLTMLSGSRPMMLPSTRLLPPVWRKMPLPLNLLMTRPRMTESPAVMSRPEAALMNGDDEKMLAPLSSMTGDPAKPGCVVPSMVTGSLMVGSVVFNLMVRTPAPGMLKVMRSCPGTALASRTAWRSEPAPASFVFVTAKSCRAAVKWRVWSEERLLTLPLAGVKPKPSAVGVTV